MPAAPRVVVAPNPFKGSLGAPAAARAMAAGVRDARPGVEVLELPVADGGEGTLDALFNALGGTLLAATVSDPLGRPVEAVFAVNGRLGIVEMADLFAALMSDVLGYRRFAAQGGDWGAFITSCLGAAYPERLAGIHINFLAVRRDQPAPATPTAEEKAYLAELAHWQREETGYMMIQGTKPQTLAYGLTDSPVGLAAWIIEKFRTWSDCGGDVERRFSRDTLLTNVMLYWVTGAIGSSFWPYYARQHSAWPISEQRPVKAPTAYASFPREILHPPRAWAERVYDIRRWTVMPSGGHFAALEEPEALAADIREFFRGLR
jgi:microsomal epoxide hydrolase